MLNCENDIKHVVQNFVGEPDIVDAAEEEKAEMEMFKATKDKAPKSLVCEREKKVI